MRKSVWSKRRMKAGLSVQDVANYLDIDYKKYYMIDKGDIKMPNKYIEKFNELMNKNKGEKKVEQLNRDEIVQKWYDEISVKQDRGHYVLDSYLNDFNIDSYKELAFLMGYNSAGTVANYLSKPSIANQVFKHRLYSFFENELNRQPKKSLEQISNKKGKCRITSENAEELLTWYNDFDLNVWLKEHNISNEKLASSLNVSTGTINRCRYKRPNVGVGVMAKLKKFIESYKEESIESAFVRQETYPIKNEEIIAETDGKTESLIEKYRDIINKLNEDFANNRGKIEDLKALNDGIAFQIEMYESVISDLIDIK